LVARAEDRHATSTRRNDLYQQVLELPMARLAAEYGIRADIDLRIVSSDDPPEFAQASSEQEQPVSLDAI
jgi:hypothetical protein